MPRLGKLPGYTTGIHLFLRVRACFSLFHSVPFLGHVVCLRRINGTPTNTLKPPETRSGICKTPIVGSIPTPASNSNCECSNGFGAEWSITDTKVDTSFPTP